MYAGAAERCSLLDKLGVPNEFLARIAASYFNESLFHTHLGETTQKHVLNEFTAFVLNRDYSAEAIASLFRERDRIITEPYKDLSKNIALESAKALTSVNQSLDTHIHSLTGLEDELLSLFETEASRDEILSLVRASFADIRSNLESNMAKLKGFAFVDPTSGLLNRRAFDATLHEAITSHKDQGTLIGLAMLDIDNFKNFNDTYGHRVGDQVIALVGRKIRKIAERSEDATMRFSAARFGGEEFAIIASGPQAHILPTLVERVRESICAFNFLIRDAAGNVLRDSVHITISGGVVLSSQPTDLLDADSLTEQADKALYMAKKSGKNRVYLCTRSQSIPYVLLSP